jgi:polysaccharide biosynthesis/export protein
LAIRLRLSIRKNLSITCVILCSAFLGTLSGQVENTQSLPGSITSSPSRQETSDTTSTSRLPLCSQARPGQACLKDSQEGVQTEIPRITGSDEGSTGLVPPEGTGGARPEEHTGKQTAPTSTAKAEESLFQEFVAGAVGRKLPIFGLDLFKNVPSTFAPLDRIPIADDYTIGPGDQLLIRAWGQIDVNYRATVEQNGTIYIPRVGSVVVTGVRYADLNDHVRAAIGRVFKDFQVSVTLGELRSIQVYVVGSAARPGTYTVSSLSTLVNTLFVSGGPSPSGSLRRVQLKRGGQVVSEFDIYDLLLAGDKSKDRRLLPGDVIYIPPVGPQVAISGNITTPAIYEIKDQTSLDELIRLSGGLSITAEANRVIIERIDDHRVRRVEEFPLSAEGRQRPLKDGDVIRVFPLNPKFENVVVLRGNVAVPGRFPWTEGMRVRDLIPNRLALVVPEFWSRVNASAAGGGVREEQLRNDIKRNAPEINWDYAVVQRLNAEDLTSGLIPFDLGKAIAGDPESNIVLQPGDVITIFSQADLQVPIFRQTKYVRLEGEMKTAGIYKVQPGETLRQLVTRIGGFTPDAYLYGARFTRESVRRQQQQNLERFVDRLEQDVDRAASNRAQNITSVEDAATFQSKVESQKRMVARLRSVRATGRVVLNVRPTQNREQDLPDLVLEDGDQLVLPNRPATVSVLGAVYNETDLLYVPEKRVEDYLREVGGPTRDADDGRIYVIRADGSIRGRQGGSWLGSGIRGERLMPGDAIVVPENLSKTTFLKGLKDFGTVFYQFALGAAAVSVLRN